MINWARLEACKRHKGYKLDLSFLVFTSKTAMKSKNTGCDNGDLFGHIQYTVPDVCLRTRSLCLSLKTGAALAFREIRCGAYIFYHGAHRVIHFHCVSTYFTAMCHTL